MLFNFQKHWEFIPLLLFWKELVLKITSEFSIETFELSAYNFNTWFGICDRNIYKNDILQGLSYSRIPGSSYIIPKGMITVIPTWSLNYDSQIYDNPSEYQPERFLPENKKNIASIAMQGFGLGPRMCIGKCHHINVYEFFFHII